ncbi:MAG: zinc ribbon domain-containing protein [Phototrophicaceae bacterium]
MSESYKICPICQTANHENATVCTTCGTDLSHVQTVSRQKNVSSNKTDYNFRYGETDLLESSVSNQGNMVLVILTTIIVTIVLVGIGLALTTDLFTFGIATEESLQVEESATTRPTVNAATVTLGPPTLTPTFTPQPTFTPSQTPTQGPCVINLPQGQTLTWALTQCGHRSLDVLPTVLALNNLSDASSVRSGQELLIPRPTLTPDPFAVPTDTPAPDGDAANEGVEVASLGLNESIEAFQPTVTPTLPAGVMWHEIQQGQNIISVAVQYSTDVQTLSQLNRQIDFARCDFGETFGGQDCIVQLFQGQLLRVPAPTPTPTLSPTPDPNATATPTPTATVNIPSAFSPTDRQFFYSDQLVTLRWVPTATLQASESYRVDVIDLTTGREFSAQTTEIFFTIPLAWQGSRNRHEYEWSVGIVSQDAPNDVRYQTQPLIFVWQGLSETESE